MRKIENYLGFLDGIRGAALAERAPGTGGAVRRLAAHGQSFHDAVFQPFRCAVYGGAQTSGTGPEDTRIVVGLRRVTEEAQSVQDLPNRRILQASAARKYTDRQPHVFQSRNVRTLRAASSNINSIHSKRTSHR